MVANTSLNSSINLTSLDFATLKSSLATYLRNQDQFKDFDFDGANMDVLLEILSYNSFVNSFYLNMAISEGFLDSAQLTTFLFSHAKELNYLPRSIRSAKANITVTFEATGESQPYTIPKGSPFSTLIKSKSFVFTLPETIIVASTNTTFTFTSDIYEGVYKKDAYVFLDNIENQTFVITNPNVDATSVSVTVYENGSQLGEIFNLTTTLLDLDQFSKVFFLQTSETGLYEIYFGDNNLGYQPAVGSTIVLDYRVSSGPAGNGARSFSVDFDPTGARELTDTPLLTVGDVANNGEDAETNDSIRYYAPRHFQVQERTITTSDYEVALKVQFPEINAVSVYGGEVLTPPQYGRVFVAVQIAGVPGLPLSKQTEYLDFLRRRAPLTIEPIMVIPDNLYLSISSIVRYDLTVTTNSDQRIVTLVTQAINNYQNTYLDNFNATLRASQLFTTIDNCDPSIISNVTTIAMYKKINPQTAGTVQNIDINFAIPLLNTLAVQSVSHPSDDMRTIWSSFFYFNGVLCTLEDDGNGTVRVVKNQGGTTVRVMDVGTVNYTTGLIQLASFSLDSYVGQALKIYALPADEDVMSNQSTLLSIEPAEIVITPQGLRPNG